MKFQFPTKFHLLTVFCIEPLGIGGKKESEEVLIGSGGSSRLSGTLPGQNEANKTRIFRQFLRINGTTGGALIRPFFGEANEHDIDTKNYLL